MKFISWVCLMLRVWRRWVGCIINRLRSLRAQGNTQFWVDFVYLYYFYIKNVLGCYSVFYIEFFIIFLLFYDFFRFTSRTSLTGTLSPNQEHLSCNLFAVYLILAFSPRLRTKHDYSGKHFRLKNIVWKGWLFVKSRKKCRRKLEWLIFEMLFISERFET